MGVELHTDEAKADALKRAGQTLLRMAVAVQVEFMRRVGRANPRPYLDSSRPGEFLRKRTGWLQGHVVYAPTTPLEAIRAGTVRVGYGESAGYGGIWELRDEGRRRKGLIDLVEEMRPRLIAIGAKA